MEYIKQINYKGNNIEVSRDGKIVKVNGNIRNQSYNKDRYLAISIKDLNNNFWTTVRVHQLVALAFIPKPNDVDVFEVNHIDYDRTNNNVNNLEWLTHKENVQYSICNRPDFKCSNNPNFGNKTLSMKYKSDKTLACIKQSRPKLQNGRCRKIDMFKDGELVFKFNYIEDCMQYIKNNINDISLISIRGRIDNSVRKNKPYLKHYTFVKY